MPDDRYGLGRRAWLLGCAFLLIAPGDLLAAEYRDVGWPALAPPGWNPTQEFGHLIADVEGLSDDDPRAKALMEKIREAGSRAPAVESMRGADVALPGYVVPIEAVGSTGLREFLLVPYFGACIHEPPPPANQAVLCRAEARVPGLQAMDAVWVFGRLDVERTSLSVGASAYTLKLASVRRQ